MTGCMRLHSRDEGDGDDDDDEKGGDDGDDEEEEEEEADGEDDSNPVKSDSDCPLPRLPSIAFFSLWLNAVPSV